MKAGIAIDERSDERCITPEAADATLAGAPWTRFVVLGDSIAEGLGDRVEGYGPGSWAERVADALARQQPRFQFENFGERYLRAREVRERQLERALRLRPDLASVVCGGNDVLLPELDSDALAHELDTLVGSLRRVGADVITFTLLDITRAIELPRSFGKHVRDRLGLLAEMTTEIALRRDTIHVEMRRHPACADPRLYSEDRLHASTVGHAICASETIRALGARLRNG
jgi:lysophospholipase L1-like esterase